MTILDVPFVVRGRVFEDYSIVHSAGEVDFQTPDPSPIVRSCLATAPASLGELHGLTLDDICAYLEELGRCLDLNKNEHMQAALELSIKTSRLPERVLRTIYKEQLAYFYRPEVLRDAAARRLGLRNLEGWAKEHGPDGRDIRVRAFGSRTAHVIAGNTPGVAAATIARNALTRGDAIIKTPSNDPLTATAIARTMIDMEPGHPLTRHVSVLYWRGGDAAIEPLVFSSSVIEKIVAWGGAAAIENAAQYVGPGVELISLDPKRSISFLAESCLTDPARMRDAATRLSRDVGMYNQEGCVNARVAYIRTALVEDVPAALGLFAAEVYSQLQSLPEAYSAPVTHLPATLQDQIDAALLFDDPVIIGSGDGAGGVVISLDGKPVDWAAELAGRYINLVPVPDFGEVMSSITTEVQTVGVWPGHLREALRDDLAHAGVQRIVTLGNATNPFGNQSIPQDGIEVMRRMCRWIVDEGDPDSEGVCP